MLENVIKCFKKILLKCVGMELENEHKYIKNGMFFMR